MVFAVTDQRRRRAWPVPHARCHDLLGSVSVAKARNVAYYDDPTQLHPDRHGARHSPGASPSPHAPSVTWPIPASPRASTVIRPGRSRSSTIRGVNPMTGLNDRNAAAGLVRTSASLGYDAFHPRPISTTRIIRSIRTASSSSRAVRAVQDRQRHDQSSAAWASAATASIRTTSSPSRPPMAMHRPAAWRSIITRSGAWRCRTRNSTVSLC